MLLSHAARICFRLTLAAAARSRHCFSPLARLFSLSLVFAARLTATVTVTTLTAHAQLAQMLCFTDARKKELDDINAEMLKLKIDLNPTTSRPSVQASNDVDVEDVGDEDDEVESLGDPEGSKRKNRRRRKGKVRRDSSSLLAEAIETEREGEREREGVREILLPEAISFFLVGSSALSPSSSTQGGRRADEVVEYLSVKCRTTEVVKKVKKPAVSCELLIL
ncbi:hypothetical protein Syun_004112 [Stephania yunnanensis]|uniref:Uncharacterized protein n=1 Tax=Stephania yunnanensis TaxID=152371 RepID=A0AAP0Q159_9MAGN